VPFLQELECYEKAIQVNYSGIFKNTIMKLITVRNNNFLLQVPSCPLDILESCYSYTYIDHGRYKIGLILEASVSKKPSKEVRKDPSYLSYELKVLQELVVGLYLLLEQKEKFSRLTGKYTNEFLNKLSKDIYGEEHRLSLDCLLLSEEELQDSFKLLKKVSKAVSLEDWFEFFEQCEQNSLAFGYEPYWDGIEKSTTCTYYIPKLHDLGYLIANSERPMK
jgi:hypothetical protein